MHGAMRTFVCDLSLTHELCMAKKFAATFPVKKSLYKLDKHFLCMCSMKK